MKQPIPSSLPDCRSLADTFTLEQALYGQGFSRVAGVDEAGRGPLAGPVVAACVILPPDGDASLFRDSKILTSRRRQQLFTSLHEGTAIIGVGLADPREIEQLNILRASLLAMRRAVESCVTLECASGPDFLLVDGTFKVPLAVNQLPLVKGESKSASIAAASIVAKVTRDQLMAQAHQQFPVYGFDRHQGYPTRDHRQALQRYGPCELHRRTFRGVAELLEEGSVRSHSSGQPRLW